jgi:hypothetical protein
MPAEKPANVSPRTWSAIRSFTESATATCADRTPYTTGELYSVCTKLALFATTILALELESETMFSANTIELFIQAGLPSWSPASRGNARSMLFRMSEVILGTVTRGSRLFALPASSPSEPYAAAEQNEVRKWKNAQGGRRASDASVLLALGFGAGLSAGEIMAARVANVEQGEDELGNMAYFINVTGQRARRVQVDSAWTGDLSVTVDERSHDEWLFCPKRDGAGKNLITNFVARGGSHGIRPNTQRMRATYLVNHLEHGTPVIELMRIAGVQSLDALARYVQFVGEAA